MVCITGGAIAYDFRINFCAARLCVFIFLQNYRTCALAHNEACTAFIEGQGCRIGVFRCIQCHAAAEACHCQRNDCRFTAAADCRCGIAMQNGSVAFTDSSCTCCTGGRNRNTGILRLIVNGNIACRNVIDNLGDEQRRNTARSFFPQHIIAFAKRFKAADAAAEINRQILFFNIAFQLTVCHRLAGCHHSELHETIQLLCCQLIHIFCRIKLLHLCRQLIFAFADIKSGDGCDTVFSVFNCFPEFRHVIAHGGHCADACYYYSSHFINPFLRNPTAFSVPSRRFSMPDRHQYG